MKKYSYALLKNKDLSNLLRMLFIQIWSLAKNMSLKQFIQLEKKKKKKNLPQIKKFGNLNFWAKKLETQI